jgi:prepilin-type N-terminal cleavage/methylation domain-containing protein
MMNYSNKTPMFTRTKNQGFTLIELLVVVSIISILSTASLSIYLDSWEQARDAVRLQDMRTINQALIAFYIDNQRFPGEPAVHGGATAHDEIEGGGQMIGVGNPIDGILERYLPEVPRDPAHDAGEGLLPTAGSSFYYSYDPIHWINPDCYVTNVATDANTSSSAVFGFNRFEVPLARDMSLPDQGRDIDTCHGGDQRLNDADFNRVPQ